MTAGFREIKSGCNATAFYFTVLQKLCPPKIIPMVLTFKKDKLSEVISRNPQKQEITSYPLRINTLCLNDRTLSNVLRKDKIKNDTETEPFRQSSKELTPIMPSPKNSHLLQCKFRANFLIFLWYKKIRIFFIFNAINLYYLKKFWRKTDFRENRLYYFIYLYTVIVLFFIHNF